MSALTTCPYCGVGCGVELAFDSTGVEGVKGDTTHPANYGRLCVKGSALHETVDASNRLLKPRMGGRAVSWDDALNEVAQRFQRTIMEHGPDSVALYLSGQILTEDYYVANKWMKGFVGTANVDTNSRLCMSSTVVGHKRAFGSDTVPGCYDDIELADLLVLVGSNAAWNHPVLYQRMVAAKKKNPALKVVVIDPRETATCKLADLHLKIKPGSDTRLFNGLLHWLADHDALNQPYIDAHTEGFEDALQAAQSSAADLNELASACDVQRADLIRFFNLFTSTERTVTFFSQGTNQSASGVDNVNAIINCHLATGRIGQPGMGPFSLTGQPNAMGGREVGGLANQLAAHMDFTPEAIDRVGRFWGAENVADKPGLKAVELFQAVERGEVKAIWIMGTNPVVSMPDADQIIRALEACETVVVSECVEDSDTAAFADILLPATGWSEKDGTVTNSERRISRQRGLLPPAGEARHDWQIMSDVASRMGFAEAFAYTHPSQIFAEHAALSGFENHGTRDFDISYFADISQAAYDQMMPVQWPVTKDNPLGSARLMGNGRFFTASGRAQFVAIVPRAPVQQPDQVAPYVLNSGRIRDQWHTMTRTGSATRLFSHRPEPFVDIHPEDAAAEQINEGDLVELTNTRGVYRGRARLEPGQRRGELFVPMHWNQAFANAGRMGTLMAPVTDMLSGQPESKHGAVSLTRLDLPWQAWLLCESSIHPPAVEYRVRIPQKHGDLYHLADSDAIEDWITWCNEYLAAPDLWIEDQTQKSFRAAGIVAGKLRWVLLVLPFDQFPSAKWLDGLLGQGELEPAQFARLLSATDVSVEDPGDIICSCYQVGSKAIERAIGEGCCSTQSLGERLQCGTQCGSCVPELQSFLSQAS